MLTTTAIQRARVPEDLFGSSADVAAVNREFRRLAAVVHPDVSGEADTFRRLVELADAARVSLEAGTYGRREVRMSPVTVASPAREYVLDRLAFRGSVANLYAGGDVYLKIARRPADNHLLAREARVLAALTGDAGTAQLRELAAPYLPGFIESFECRMGTVHRRAIALRRLPRLDPLAAPLPARDLVRVFRAGLMGLGFAHALGYAHGALEPAHVLVQRRRRGLVLVDWKAARPVAERPPRHDIRALAGLVRDSADGPLPRRLRLFLEGCRHVDDAWRLVDELDDLLN